MSIQRKMFICIVAFLIIPFLLLGFLYYGILVDKTKDNLDNSSYEVLRQMEQNILYKTSRLKNKTDVLLSDRRLQELLRNTDFTHTEAVAYNAFFEINEIMEQYFYDERDIESIILFSEDGGIYTYKGYFEDENVVSFKMKYGKVDDTHGSLSWFGVAGDPDMPKKNSAVAAGVQVNDLSLIHI